MLVGGYRRRQPRNPFITEDTPEIQTVFNTFQRLMLVHPSGFLFLVMFVDRSMQGPFSDVLNEEKLQPSVTPPQARACARQVEAADAGTAVAQTCLIQ